MGEQLLKTNYEHWRDGLWRFMRVSKIDSFIELTEQETKWFFNSSISVPVNELQMGEGLFYRNFRDKVEHCAKEIYYGNGLTVIIYVDSSDEPTAICNENGLVAEEKQSPESAEVSGLG